MAKSEMQEALAAAEAAAEKLASESEQAQQAIEGLNKRVSMLDERIELVGDESKDRLQHLMQELEKAQHDYDSHGATLKQNYAELVKKAGEVEHQTEELVQKIHAGTQEVQHAHQEVENNINHEADDKKHKITELTQKIEQLHKSVEEEAHEAESLVNTFKDNVDHAVHSVKDNTDHFTNELKQVQSTHDEETHGLVDTISQFVSHAGSTMSEMHGNLEHMTEGAIGQVGTQFMEEAINALTGSSGPLHSAFETLTGNIGDHHESFMGKFQGIASQVENITDVLKPIEPVIDAIKALT
jgi:chromosome segregation ATPase